MLLATYNIHYGVGADHKYDVERIARTIEQADIVACQEVVQGWPQNGFEDQAATIARALNRHYVFYGPFDVDGGATDAGGRIVHRRRTFGNLILSRWPIRSSRVRPLPHNALSNQFDLQRGAIEAVIDAPGLPLRVYCAHLSHVSDVQRLPQVHALLDFARQAPANGSPWDVGAGPNFIFQDRPPPMPKAAVIMGDMNFTPLDPEYPLVAGHISKFYGRMVGTEQFVDAWTHLGNDEYAESFPREGRIDHIFVSPPLAPALSRAWIDNQAFGSDHWPLFAELDTAKIARD
ncbi:MAG: endonuclease/exonuclease/phosphatase family protein [Reyranellaceae bacterium]